MRTSLNKRDFLPTAFGRIAMHVPRAQLESGDDLYMYDHELGLRQVELALAAWCLVNHLISVFLVVTTSTTWNHSTMH
jgi:hypothetical protein